MLVILIDCQRVYQQRKFGPRAQGGPHVLPSLNRDSRKENLDSQIKDSYGKDGPIQWRKLLRELTLSRRKLAFHWSIYQRLNDIPMLLSSSKKERKKERETRQKQKDEGGLSLFYRLKIILLEPRMKVGVFLFYLPSPIFPQNLLEELRSGWIVLGA